MMAAIGLPTASDSLHADKSARDQLAAAIRGQLEFAREAISRELCTIPPPVPNCDVHFNRLLEDRSRVVDELRRLVRLVATDAPLAELKAFEATTRSLVEDGRASAARAAAATGGAD